VHVPEGAEDPPEGLEPGGEDAVVVGEHDVHGQAL
jgi:hypothetical protein